MGAIGQPDIQMSMVLELDLGSPIGMLRACPVRFNDGVSAILAIYSADFDVDPSYEMFFFPTDTLKLALFTEQGELLWKRDLGKNVIPGIWFCPVFPFDLDGDGNDEIWFVNNLNAQHPLSLESYVLERIDGKTGETTGQWPWVYYSKKQALSPQFRNFIVGGYVHGRPVLVTAQGTYGDMYVQGWNPDMTSRWKTDILKTDPGARGSHITPVIDLNQDGVDELMWGERCIELDRGAEIFCADRDVYGGHSDVIQPIWDGGADKWRFLTIRETDPTASPRVIVFDEQGERVWGDVEQGHMDMGWAARLNDDRSHVAMAIRIGSKTCGPDGRFHFDRDEFTYDAISGNKRELPYSIYRTFPVDVNGDGYHELIRGVPGGDGELFDRFGGEIAKIGGTVAMASKFMRLPGEQLLVFYPDGKLRVWADKLAEDNEHALARYRNPFYQASQRLTGVGYNLVLMAGI